MKIMLNDFMEELKKMVKAIEQIAANGMAPGPLVEAASSNESSTATKVRDYKALDRPALLALCEKRGLEAPKGVRDTTLIKNLQTWDVANPDLPPREDDPVEDDPVEDDLLEDDSDPFGVKTEEEKSDIRYTIQEVRAALQTHMAKPKNDAAVVVALLKEYGGVSKLIDLAEDKYAEIMEAVK